MPNRTNTWSLQTATIRWKKSGNTQAQKSERWCIPQIPSCGMPDGQKEWQQNLGATRITRNLKIACVSKRHFWSLVVTGTFSPDPKKSSNQTVFSKYCAFWHIENTLPSRSNFKFFSRPVKNPGSANLNCHTEFHRETCPPPYIEWGRWHEFIKNHTHCCDWCRLR